MKRKAGTYVDGYVLLLPKSKLRTYKKMAAEACEFWMKHGALDYYECLGEDLESAKKIGCLPFRKMTKAKDDEHVVFAFIVYESKAHRNKVNKLVLKEFLESGEDCEMPFKMSKMAVGGFKVLKGARR